jgi:outer membrane protein, multidrug efflux system
MIGAGNHFGFSWVRLSWLAAGGALLLAGCAVGPNYQQPDVKSPDSFRGAEDAATNSTNSFGDLPWWKVFHDETLQGVIRMAVTNNYDVRIALKRVEEAGAIAAQARAEFFPQLGYAGSIARAKNASSGTPVYNGTTSDTYIAAGTASWEIDLWGRIRRLNESARAQYLASEEARRDVTISVISQAATAYFQLLALDRELQIAKDATNSFGQSLKIFSERMNGGVASKLESSSAEALMATAAAVIPDLERQIALQENQLNVLLGQPPGPFARGAGTFTNLLEAAAPAGLPSALLERRPDIRLADQNLRSANARVGVAVADFFPQISLTGLFGRVSPELSAMTGGSANAWSIAANLTGPLFQGGRLTAQYRQAKAFWEESKLEYYYAVLEALQEVSDALISRQKSAEARVQWDQAVAAYKEAVDVATSRYRMGQASYYEVLQEQQLLFPAENSLVQSELNQVLAVVQLYRALGGGWMQENP